MRASIPNTLNGHRSPSNAILALLLSPPHGEPSLRSECSPNMGSFRTQSRPASWTTTRYSLTRLAEDPTMHDMFSSAKGGAMTPWDSWKRMVHTRILPYALYASIQRWLKLSNLTCLTHSAAALLQVSVHATKYRRKRPGRSRDYSNRASKQSMKPGSAQRKPRMLKQGHRC